MRTQCICLVLAIVLICPFASAQWFTQNGNTTRNLLGVSLTDANTGTVVGDSGTILRTVNGGATWTTQSSGTSKPLRGISLTDASHGTVVGDSGTILRTTNGGASWTVQSSGTAETLESVSFTDASTGAAVGWGKAGGGVFWWDYGIILLTTNGGASWTLVPNVGYGPPYGVSFTDANTGTAVGDPGPGGKVIRRTTDGGASWTLQSSGTTETLRSVYFIDASIGWAVGYDGTILHTTNGGVTFIDGDEVGEIATDFSLSHNYPNPFNPTTTMKYELPKASHVSLTVYDMLGRELSVLVNERRDAGVHEVKFDGSNLASGAYFYRLQADNFVQTRRLMLLK